jgi:uncharacterized protein YigE (DUF2233 family)
MLRFHENAHRDASLFGLLLGQARDAQSVECAKTPAGDATVVVCRVDLRTDRLRLFHADAQAAATRTSRRCASR